MLNCLKNTRIKKELPPGDLIGVEDCRLHFYATGPANKDMNGCSTPTIIIEGGRGYASPVYSRLQKTLSQTSRVCSYDRAGLGWSTPSRQPRDAEHIATQLKILLQKAECRYGFTGPYLFIGHSIAGLYLRVYAHRYLHDVAGLVFIDASHPQQYAEAVFSDAVRHYFKHNEEKNRLGKVSQWMLKHGFTRLLKSRKVLQRSQSLSEGALSLLPADAKQQLLYFAHCPQTYLTPQREKESFSCSAMQAIQAGDLDDTPLLVLTAGEPSALPAELDKKTYQATWLRLQHQLAGLSGRAEHKVIDGACHSSIVTEQKYADQVANEIASLIKSL